MELAWVKSSYSNGSGGSNCVEVAWVTDEPTGAEGIAVRHSQHPNGPALYFTRSEWNAFLLGVRSGEFDTAELLDRHLRGQGHTTDLPI